MQNLSQNVSSDKCYPSISAILLSSPFRFFYLFTHPRSGLSVGAAIRTSVCGYRLGTALGIPCFHAEFPVVRGAEGSKEHNLPAPGYPWNPRGKLAENMAYISVTA